MVCRANSNTGTVVKIWTISISTTALKCMLRLDAVEATVHHRLLRCLVVLAAFVSSLAHSCHKSSIQWQSHGATAQVCRQECKALVYSHIHRFNNARASRADNATFVAYSEITLSGYPTKKGLQNCTQNSDHDQNCFENPNHDTNTEETAF